MYNTAETLQSVTIYSETDRHTIVLSVHLVYKQSSERQYAKYSSKCILHNIVEQSWSCNYEVAAIKMS